MVSALGVSVGASAVRVAYPDDEGAVFRSFPVDSPHTHPEQLVADSIETVMAECPAADEVQAIGVAYRDQAQAAAVQAAMGDCRLVPEVTAVLRQLEASGQLGDHSTLVFYDLGSSGLTVTVVDRLTGEALGAARTDEISGDGIDRLIRDHQLEQERIARPADEAAEWALTERCRRAKEELSTNTAVCVPGDGGLLLLSQDNLDSLIVRPVEASARLAREVIASSGRRPDAVVLIGGGAYIPLVASLMESWLALPVIVPAQPELVAAEGAAVLAQEHSGSFGAGPAAEKFAKPVIRAGALAGGALAVVAVIGLGLGYGNHVRGAEGEAQPAATQPSAEEASSSPTPSPVAPPPAAVSIPEPAQEEASVPEPAPAPAPAPRPLIPGLPQIQLPTLPPPPPLPPLPRIPGL